MVPPIFTRWSTKDDGGGGVIAGPFVHAHDPAGSTTALFPIYWRFHDTAHDATTHILFPIAGIHHHTGARGGFVGPVYGWSSSNGAGGWGAGVAPIAFFGRNGTRSHALILPVFARFSDTRTGTATTGVGPLFWRTTPDGGDGGLFPILFAGRHKKASYAVIPGLLFHKSDATSSTDVVGPVYVARDKDGWAAGLAPLAFFGRDGTTSHQVIFPLVWHFADSATRSDRLIVGPYIHRRDGDEVADAFFPFFYVRRSPHEGFGIWPIGAWRRLDGVSTTVVGPFVHQSNARTGSRTNMLFPLLTIHDSPRYSVRVLFPFVWRVRDGDETDTAIFPLYFRGRAPDHGFDGVFPLFVHAYNKDVADHARRPHLVSLAHRRRQDGRPLPAPRLWQEGPGRQVVVVVRHARRLRRPQRASPASAHTWVLDFFHFTRPDGYTSGVIPIAFAWRRGTASKILTPIYYRQADSARDYSLDVFTLLFAGHEGKSWKFGIFPLFMAGHDADGGWRTRRLPALLGLAQQGPRDAGDAHRRLLAHARRQALLRGPLLLSQRRRDHLGRALPDRLLRQEPHVGRVDVVHPAAVPRHPPQRRSPARRLLAARLALPQRRGVDDHRPAALLRRQPLRRVAHHGPVAAVHSQPLVHGSAPAATRSRRS